MNTPPSPPLPQPLAVVREHCSLWARKNMYARISIVFLTTLVSSLGLADEAKPTLLLKPLQLQCDDQRNLETLLAQRDKRPNDGILELMYGSGAFCMPTTNHQRVYLVRDVQGTHHSYVCYRLWDHTRPAPPDEKEQEFCSASGAITTMAELVNTRSGDYSIEVHEQYEQSEFAVATCHEHGRVFVKRRLNGWDRSSSLPIDSPLKEAPAFVEGNLPDVLRDGCRGKDYL